MKTKYEKIEVENINVPSYKSKVDKEKYSTIKNAMLKVLPKSSPGLNQKEMKEKIASMVPVKLFPNGEKVGWWAKTVQLDLEAKGIIKRLNKKPLEWVKNE